MIQKLRSIFKSLIDLVLAKKLISVVLVLLIFFFTFFIIFLSKIGPVDKNDKEPVFIEISSGQSFVSVLDMLESNNLIKSKFYAKILLKFKNKNLKAGYYRFTRSMSVSEIFDLLTEGKEFFIPVSIPEGSTVFDITSILEKKGFDRVFIEDFNKSLNDKTLIEKYSIPFDNLEGYIFPSTYYLPKNFDGKKFAEIALKTFRFKTKDLFSNIDKNTEKRVMIIGSIIEKEARLDTEKPIIASVFYNRLEKNMPLESCATVIYTFERIGIHKVRLLYKDLSIDSPYNTYRNRGLPPAPISNPGLESIKAALYPLKTDYLYFVYKGNKEHYFSRTLKEHMDAYKKYILYQKVNR